MKSDESGDAALRVKTLIEPIGRFPIQGVKDLWLYRELFFFLGWRDIKVRYKQTALGLSWAILNPVMQMTVWAFVFGLIADLPSDGIPYVLVTLSGTLAWSYFTEIVNGAAGSLISNVNMITKIYFPKILIPLSISLRALLDFSVGLVLLLLIMVCMGTMPSIRILAVPFFLFILTLTATGLGLFMAALSVKYRDVGKILPYFIHVLFFITPVAYLASVIPDEFFWVCALNPVAGIIEGLRWSLLGTPADWSNVWSACALSCLVLISGMLYFAIQEQTFADVI